MINDIFNLVRGAHALYNSDDPNYYNNMGHSPYGFNNYGGNSYYGGYNNASSYNSNLFNIANC